MRQAPVSSHGDFYDALFSMQQQDDFENSIEEQLTIHSLMQKWNASMKQVFECLMGEETPIDQAQVVERTGLTKSSVSKACTRLTDEKFRTKTFVEVIKNDRNNYWVTDEIKREVNSDY